MKNFLFRLRAAIGRRTGNRLLQVLLHMKTDHLFQALYGDFHFGESMKRHTVKGLSQESGQIYGGVVRFLSDIKQPIKSLLLPGESDSAKKAYSAMLGLPVADIRTAGIMDGMDYFWNYENDPVIEQRFQCIISQSMLEHLIDPYKHVRDCHALLEPGGYLIVHTVMPGFSYHRYPVDCMRFYPDWFEEVAKRLSMVVEDKYIHNTRITYKFRKSLA